MGAISGLVGAGGGANGTGFSTPSGGTILNPVSSAQAQASGQLVDNATQQQQMFLNELAGQNGIQNQSSVFNQLQGVANGTGPNPAQAMLNQSTGANTANQAALMAGQRGTGANAGLIARQAAQQGAANQQNAAGQGATMQANQSLNALNQLGGIAGQQVGQQQAAQNQVTNAQLQEQQALLGGVAAQNNANVGMQSNINTANAGLANTQMGAQNNLIGNVTGGVGSALGLAQGGVVPKMAGGGYSPVSVDYNNHDNVFATSPLASGATDMSTVGPQAAPAPAMPAAPIAPTVPPAIAPASTLPSNPNAPKSSAGKFFSGMSTPAPQAGAAANPLGNAGQSIGKGIGNAIGSLFGPSSTQSPYTGDQTDQRYLDADNALTSAANKAGVSDNMDKPNIDMPADNASGMPMAAKGGKVPALVSPGERYLSPKEVSKVAKGKNPMEAGEKIPGKPKVGGNKNSYANDTVPKTLEEGGIILPRSVTQSRHPHWAAHAFVSALMAKQGNKLPTKVK